MVFYFFKNFNHDLQFNVLGNVSVVKYSAVGDGTQKKGKSVPQQMIMLPVWLCQRKVYRQTNLSPADAYTVKVEWARKNYKTSYSGQFSAVKRFVRPGFSFCSGRRLRLWAYHMSAQFDDEFWYAPAAKLVTRLYVTVQSCLALNRFWNHTSHVALMSSNLPVE